MTDLVKAWQKKVHEMAGQFRKLFLSSGRLLQEAADGEYHKELGFDSLKEYVQDEFEKGKCPIQWREAFDRLRVVRMLDALELKDAYAEPIASVKLKIVSGLDVEKHKAAMLDLLAQIKKAPVKCDMNWVKAQCDALKGKAAPTVEGEGEGGEGGEGEGGEGETETKSVNITLKFGSQAEADLVKETLEAFAKANNLGSKSAAILKICQALAKPAAMAA